MSDAKLPRKQKIWRCAYCGRTMDRESSARRENPVCERCLEGRLRSGAKSVGRIEWREDGHYLVPNRVP